MIQVYRKIRQKLLAQNNFQKYVMYAIGEIFLVVVGILLPMIFSALTMSDTNTILINLSIGLIIAGLLSYPITVQRIRDVVGSNNLYILSSLVATVVLPFVVFLWLVFPGRQGAK